MKLSRLFLAGLACVSIAFMSVSAETSAQAQKTAVAKTATHVVKGTVVSVDAIGNTLIVKTKSAEDTFYVDSTTTIKSGKKKLTLGELSSGTPVIVYYKKAEGKNVATNIIEKKAKPKAKPKAKSSKK